MSLEIKWTDEEASTGQRRFIRAERFARVWEFRWKYNRRGDYYPGLKVTRVMWEHVLESMKRRYQRREVQEEDIKEIEKILKEFVD